MLYRVETDLATGYLLSEQIEKLNNYTGALDLVIDVGAHQGTFALCAVERGAKRVVAIEPDPDNYDLLVENITTNEMEGCIKPLRAAAWVDSFCELTLRAPTMSGVNSGQRSLVFKDTFPGIPVVSVDLWALLKELGYVDYLKMDIEGGEWALLADPRARQALRAVGYVNIEVHPLSNTNYFSGDIGMPIDAALDLLDSIFDIEDVGALEAPVWRGYARGSAHT